MVGAAVVAAAAVFVALAGSALTKPHPARIGNAPEVLRARNVNFSSASGATVHGWLSIVERSKGAVLLLPGVRANRTSMIDRARFLRASGYSVLLIDLQGTGETVAEHITFGHLESRDVAAAVALLRRELPGQPIAVIGTSLGAAAALLATPPLQVDAMVVEAVYPTIEQATTNRLVMRFGAVGRLGAPLLTWQLRPRLGISASELRPIDRIHEVRCPIFVMGGLVDRHTPAAETRAIFSRARPPKRLWLVPGAAHVDLHRFAPAEYERRVLDFLRASLPQFESADRVVEDLGRPVAGDVLHVQK